MNLLNLMKNIVIIGSLLPSLLMASASARASDEDFLDRLRGAVRQVTEYQSFLDSIRGKTSWGSTELKDIPSLEVATLSSYHEGIVSSSMVCREFGEILEPLIPQSKYLRDQFGSGRARASHAFALSDEIEMKRRALRDVITREVDKIRPSSKTAVAEASLSEISRLQALLERQNEETRALLRGREDEVHEMSARMRVQDERMQQMMLLMMQLQLQTAGAGRGGALDETASRVSEAASIVGPHDEG